MPLSAPILKALAKAVADKLLSSKSGGRATSVELLSPPFGFSSGPQVIGKLDSSDLTEAVEEVLTDWLGQKETT